MTINGYPPLLDGFDADVMLCPSHEWVDQCRLPPASPQTPKLIDWYTVTVCHHCGAARCGYRGDTNRCLLARHHTIEPHRYPDGTTKPVGT